MTAETPDPVDVIHDFAWRVHDSGGKGTLSRNAAAEVVAALGTVHAEQRVADVRKAQAQALRDFHEERCCDDAYADRQDFGKYSVYTCADVGMACRTRLVGPWSDMRQADRIEQEP